MSTIDRAKQGEPMRETIRQHIERDLTARLRSPGCDSVDLTLQGLAAHYNVSFTPVRQALSFLIEKGVLTRRENGRIEVVALRQESDQALAVVASSMPPRQSEELVRKLTGEVVLASLRAETGYLREEATAKRLGVGRTAIRQAFGHLSGKGLLIHVPRCGWKIRLFDSVDLNAYIELRELLELKALELARPNLLQDDLKRMLAGNEAGPQDSTLDNQIHSYLVEKSANRYIKEFFERNGAYYTTLFDYAAPETKTVRLMANQHRAILKALIAHDWQSAKLALVQHIRAQRPVVEELLRRVASMANHAQTLESA